MQKNFHKKIKKLSLKILKQNLLLIVFTIRKIL